MNRALLSTIFLGAVMSTPSIAESRIQANLKGGRYSTMEFEYLLSRENGQGMLGGGIGTTIYEGIDSDYEGFGLRPHISFQREDSILPTLGFLYQVSFGYEMIRFHDDYKFEDSRFEFGVVNMDVLLMHHSLSTKASIGIGVGVTYLSRSDYMKKQFAERSVLAPEASEVRPLLTMGLNI